MGFWSSVWDTVKSVGRTVAKVVKKTYEVLTDDKTVEVYDRLETIIDKTRTLNQGRSETTDPDFFGSISLTEIDSKLAEQNRQIALYKEEQVYSQKITALQIELTRLRGAAELIDRSIKNVKMHASGLSVHYQNMRNINGLVNDVNTLRYGLKAVISTINHNANVMSNGYNNLRKIEGVDIDKKEGSISQVAAFDAFDRTRELLKNEVIELSRLSSTHLQDIEKLKLNAASIGGELGHQIVDYIDREVAPVFRNTEKASLLLRSEVSELPVAIRDENGRLKFNDGKILLDSER